MKFQLAILNIALLLPLISFGDDDALLLGQEYTQQFYDKDISTVWSHMTEQMQAALGSEASLRGFRDQVGGDIGREVELLDEKVESVQGVRVYTRTARFEKFDGLINVVWSLDDKNRISGFFVAPRREAVASPYLDYETKAQLQLPFNGEWFVFWGGRTVEDNYHVIAADQRFAYDILIIKDGESYSGDGLTKEQYYCWGEPVLAPASGTVVTAISNLPDNEPGVMDASNPPGNHVIIDLGNDEYALLAHLQQNSVLVEAGAKVAAGDTLGLCGNSGNTSEPHIHFHIQDELGFGNGNGKPAPFVNYLSDGVLVDRGEPIRGESVRNAD